MFGDPVSTLPDRNKPIAVWLLLCCALIFVMVVLGGVTRLTGSGLSIVTWQPVSGVIPPLNHAQWEETFRLYQQFPQFQHENFDLDLEGFKRIYLIEYAHRLLGRLIGLVFLVPMLYFIFAGKIPKELKPKLMAIFALGGLQGLLGWYMVKSGLVHDPHVSPYRLVAHLGLALVIYAFIFRTAMSLLYQKTNHATVTGAHNAGRFSSVVTVMIFITMLSGGFVAGLKAGFIYNTFPLMGEHWIPGEILDLTPLWRNPFENPATAQFDHRVLAATVSGIIFIFWLYARRSTLSPRGHIALNLLLMALVLQITLGISTLLLEVPVFLAAAHQAGAVLLFSAALFANHALKQD